MVSAASSATGISNLVFVEIRHIHKMSWGEYITNLQGQGLAHAILAGKDGSWIQSSDSKVSSILLPIYKIMVVLGSTISNFHCSTIVILG